jgi:putative endonuclease
MSKANHLYYVYIVASRTHVLYIGVTSEIELRVWQHKQGTYDGFTKKYKCNRLVYFERFAFIDTAIPRETELKGWRRDRKIALIESSNPTWQDLSAGWGEPIASATWAEEMRKQKQHQPQILRAKSTRSE